MSTNNFETFVATPNQSVYNDLINRAQLAGNPLEADQGDNPSLSPEQLIHLRERMIGQSYLSHAERRRLSRRPFVRVDPEMTLAEDYTEATRKLTKAILNSEVSKVISQIEDADSYKTQKEASYVFHYDKEPEHPYELPEYSDYVGYPKLVAMLLLVLITVVGCYLAGVIPYDGFIIYTIVSFFALVILFCAGYQRFYRGKLVVRRTFWLRPMDARALSEDLRTDMNSGLTITMHHMPMEVQETISFIYKATLEDRATHPLDHEDHEFDVTRSLADRGLFTFDQLAAIRNPRLYRICGELYAQLTGPNFMNCHADALAIRDTMDRVASKYSSINFDRYDHAEEPFMNLTVRVAHFKLLSVQSAFIDPSF